MRYSAEHKAQTREKLLDASGSLAKCGGFASTGVDGLMKAIGLTGGAFYGHFSSKDELFAAIVERELSRSAERLGSSDASRDKLQRCLAMYLNMKHVQQPSAGCAIPALGAEIARADAEVRATAEHWLARLQQAWARELGDEQLAWAILAQCVGALVLARMMASQERQEEVLASSRALIASSLGQN
ncbi:TetR/AcrR family transcriptional regulator [Pseudomonas paralcaligenes]|uniref:TetR/AcrR family transcriptional regulator n=1 Tax=Pseudomonas paralcaligenes TaxID=2772558 RepID=UPI001C819A2E|nr:TetR/AcrR family transcriptional regulator [Pseudomonas paralcaligenes]